MKLTRRHIMAGAAVAGAAGTLPIAARAQSAAPAGGTGSAQAPAFHRLMIGDTRVTAISDGNLYANASVLPNADEADFAEAMEAMFLPTDRYTMPLNTYVVERNGRLMLVDAGGSTQMAPTLGLLQPHLAAAGVDPAAIETVLLTHLHPDHIGGLVDGAGGAAFPNAELVVAANELAFWTDPATRAALPDGAKGMVDGIVKATEVYEGRVRPFEGATGVDGVEAVPLPGHTPGHTGYRISDGGQSLLIWGDIVHIAPLQVPNPDIYIGFDTVPEEAVATRKRIMDEAATDKLLITGMHLPFPGFAHLVRDGEGYALVPVPWQYL
ncbi:MBL fold metallo-hydrolase [Acuticoccus kandeliae]|uniref:MBL fold metallo-hydrolase n=1 Tax=Acuticoccus kandeliae TaxID=2073160 RepID=UPI000D3E467D|nr:MBL fold metallo-hydrolase [Acuticoccus kandeliae]